MRADPGSRPSASSKTGSSSPRSTPPARAYRRVYGVRKTWKELRRRGVEVGRDRVARLMRAEGLEGVRRGKKKRTTIPDEGAVERARDLLQRDFSATRPNEKWVADVTYVRTWQGFVYLAFILDCYSRMIVGWQLATHLRTGPRLGRARDGEQAPPAERRLDRPLGQRLAVHEHHLHRPARRARSRSLGRLARRRLRRDGRGVGRDLQERARRRPPLPHRARWCVTRGALAWRKTTGWSAGGVSPTESPSPPRSRPFR